MSEGKISIDLRLGGGVRVVSHRSETVAALLRGRRLDEAVGLLAMVFSICSHAHVAAGRAAAGQKPRRRDGVLVAVENAREHLLRIMLGWRSSDRVDMPVDPVIDLVAQTERAIGSGRVDCVAQDLDEYLLDHVFGVAPHEFVRLDGLDGFSRWLDGSDTPAARHLRGVIADGWQRLGGVQLAPLPDMPAEELISRMREGGYCLFPDWRGEPRETGALARQRAHPLVAAVARADGFALLARLVARLVDLALLPDLIRAGGIQACSQWAGGQGGLGIVETARGRLIHWARMDGQVVADYRILAPTEWNFHPRGVAAQALCGLTTRQARAVIEAIDPCVDYELRVA